MKKLVIVVVLILTIITACNKDDQLPQWTGIGTIEKLDANLDEFTIVLDGGERLIPNKTVTNNGLDDGQRVLAQYSITNELGNDSYEIDLYEIQSILTKDIIQLTEAINDSIGNDPVFLDESNIWISGSYLNFVISYYGSSGQHRINLVKLYEDTHTESGRLILEFRHNDGNDFSNYLISGVTSFNLESLKEPNIDEIEFVVRVELYDESSLEWEGSYTFNSTLKSKENYWPKNKFIDLSSARIK